MIRSKCIEIACKKARHNTYLEKGAVKEAQILKIN